MILPKYITIVIDRQEKKPLPIRKTISWSEPGSKSALIEVRTEQQTLHAGDYLLKEAGNLCIVERKGRMEELHTNFCTKDRGRAHAAYAKLARATQNPILALDFPISQSLYIGTGGRRHQVDADKVLTRLAQMCTEFNLQVLTVGSGINARRCLADLVVRVLLAHYLNERTSSCPIEPLLMSPSDPSST